MNIITDVVLPIALAFIMFSLGLGLATRDFTRILLKPKEFMFNADRINDLLNYTPGVQLRKNKGDFSKFGATGVGATIIAYDSLLMSISADTYILPLDEPEKLKVGLFKPWEEL